MSDITPEQVIAQIDEWRGHPVRYEVLGGGITNHNFLLTVDGEPGARPASSCCASRQRHRHLIDREREHRNHVAAAAAGVTPPVPHLIQPGYCGDRALHHRRDHHTDTIAGHPERCVSSSRRSGPTTTGPSSTTRSASST